MYAVPSHACCMLVPHGFGWNLIRGRSWAYSQMIFKKYEISCFFYTNISSKFLWFLENWRLLKCYHSRYVRLYYLSTRGRILRVTLVGKKSNNNNRSYRIRTYYHNNTMKITPNLQQLLRFRSYYYRSNYIDVIRKTQIADHSVDAVHCNTAPLQLY